MKRSRRTLAVAVSISVGMGAGATAAHAETASVLYVFGSAGTCTDSGTGTAAAPFCTIQAAADAAAPGDTVQIQQGSYDGALDIKSQGTASAPIVFQTAGGPVLIGVAPGQTGPALSFDGASYVTFEGNATGTATQQFGIPTTAVNGSSHITLDGIDNGAAAGLSNGVEVGGTSSSVTISRSLLEHVVIDAGGSDDIVTTNYVQAAGGQQGISVAGASNTEITSNTIENVSNTGYGIDVSASTGTSIENNIVTNEEGTRVGAGADVAVDAASAPSTTLDYNVFWVYTAGPVIPVQPYSWAGAAYGSASALYQATGQGRHDLNMDPDIDAVLDPFRGNAPQLNSADASAPGMLDTDMFGKSCQTDPLVPVTGTGSPAYCARGAAQPQLTTELATPLAIAQDAQSVRVFITPVEQYVTENQGPTQLEVSLNAPPISYTVAWGDGQTQTVSEGEFAPHVYAKRGTYTITDTANLVDGTTMTATTPFTTAGSDFTPITPTRVLDTRSGVGGSLGAVPAGICDTFQVSGLHSIPDGITAIAANLTATGTKGGGYFSMGGDGLISNLNYAPGQTVANSVIIPVSADGTASVCNEGADKASAEAILDVTGYFAQGNASGYAQVPLDRILDTRHAIGASTAKIAANAGVPVKATGLDSIPAGATAVAVHVTVTDTTGAGWIAAEPDGAGVPTTSTLNYGKGQTISNTVIVPVGPDGKFELYNGGGTTPVDLVADVSGYFSAAAPASYVPAAATRVWDSRTMSRVLSAHGTQSYPLAAAGGGTDEIPAGASVITNVTMTDETSNGFVTVYPGGTPRPSTSNINYGPRESVAGLSILNGTGSTQLINVYNNSAGSADIVLDVFGYFASI